MLKKQKKISKNPYGKRSCLSILKNLFTKAPSSDEQMAGLLEQFIQKKDKKSEDNEEDKEITRISKMAEVRVNNFLEENGIEKEDGKYTEESVKKIIKFKDEQEYFCVLYNSNFSGDYEEMILSLAMYDILKNILEENN
jgi:hypothetical protein